MKKAFAVLAVLALGAAGLLWWYVAHTSGANPADAGELFKYGSIGAEGTSLPTALWKALPDVCPDLLPGGYASLGFVYEPGRDRPIGITERTVGVPRAAFNCATCHVGTVRASAGAPPQIVIGMPAHRLDVQRYTRFVMACIDSDRFTPARVMPIVEAKTRLSRLDAFMFRFVLLPGTKREVHKLRARFAWFDTRPDFGPGRFDDFNPYKPDMSHDTTIGASDMPAIWNQAAREGHLRHWDGNATSLRESSINSALGAGATPSSLNLPALAAIEGYLSGLPPPAYPFAVDRGRAAEGERVFAAQCASCHAPGSPGAGKVTAIADVATDRHRLDTFTQQVADITNRQGEGFPWQFHGYHPSTGYVNVLLDGIWARAPYLHNGSVPTLRDLLDPPAERPQVFYRGSDVYDTARVGFRPEAFPGGFRFDTRQPGNGNAGHLYGTALSAAEKDALVEYLKTR
jgi:mono/diheme cytochrome c family protein